MDDGLAGYAAVDPVGKATTTWALLKAKTKEAVTRCVS
jgi:hypothetical protein